MSYIKEFMGAGKRPYPLDKERRRRVMVALAENDLTISGLARNLERPQSLISMIINGRRVSEKTEQLIADFLGKDTEYLFPIRTGEDISEMRKEEAAGKGKVA